MKSLFFVLAMMFASMTLSGPAPAASFNCQDPRGRTESAVCWHPRLSALDERLAYWYDRALLRARHFGQTRSVRNDQRAWIAERNTCGGHWICLERAYKRRLDQLRRYATHV